MNLSATCYCAVLAACALSACGSDAEPASPGNAGASGSEAGSAGEAPLDSAALDEAQWPMPNSPDLGLPNPADYDSATTPGVVHDLVTGLDWLQDPGLDLYTRADALGHCADLSFAGFDDWRAPTFIELVSLFNELPNQADPNDPLYIAPVFGAEGRFWSTTPVSSGGLGRLLDFTAYGCGTSARCSIGVAGQADSPVGGAFCVRNSRPPTSSERYHSSGDQVTDLRTGLTWQTVPAQVQTGTYSDALSVCAGLGNGARLPSITELLSILVPRLDNRAFPGWPVAEFAWSSSSIPVESDGHWLAATGGATEAGLSTDQNRVLCVR